MGWSRISSTGMGAMQYPRYQGDCPHLQGYVTLDGKCHSMCAHTLFELYFCLSPHDLQKLRVIKEYLVLQGVILIWSLALLIFLYGFLNLASNTSCTSPNSKRAFLTVVSETIVGKNIVTKTAFGKFFSDVRFFHEEVVGGLCKYDLYNQLFL